MICKTNIPEIQTEIIIESLGEFDSNEGMLKMFARRGLCFSTTKYITVLDEKENVSYIEDIQKPNNDVHPEDRK